METKSFKDLLKFKATRIIIVLFIFNCILAFIVYLQKGLFAVINVIKYATITYSIFIIIVIAVIWILFGK